MVWNGGMSFHGGLIGVVLATTIFCKKHKINSYIFLDLIALVAPIGLFLGRVANFINSELYGRETDVFWSVKFVKVDKKLYRLLDVNTLNGDYSKAKKKIGWKPKTDFKKLVKIMVSADMERWTRWKKGESFPWDANNYINENKMLFRRYNKI